jgi:small subunit ribosomal protein S20
MDALGPKDSNAGPATCRVLYCATLYLNGEFLVPNIKAAIKWARQTEKRTTRNLDTKTRLKTVYKKAAAGADAETLSSVEAQFDKAAQKGIIHPNKAARKKSRLAAANGRAAAAAAAPAAAKIATKSASGKKKKSAR